MVVDAREQVVSASDDESVPYEPFMPSTSDAQGRSAASARNRLVRATVVLAVLAVGASVIAWTPLFRHKAGSPTCVDIRFADGAPIFAVSGFSEGAMAALGNRIAASKQNDHALELTFKAQSDAAQFVNEVRKPFFVWPIGPVETASTRRGPSCSLVR
jgi:hypothetical protein